MRATAPDFRLQAVASGRPVGRAECAGRPLLLLFHDQHSIELVRTLQTQVRARYPVDRLLAASVVNLAAVPRLLRGTAQGFMAAAYHSAARELPSGLDPAEHVLILPDWTGETYRAFGVNGSARPVSVLLDGGWRVHARVEGPDFVAGTVAALASLIDGGAGGNADDAQP